VVIVGSACLMVRWGVPGWALEAIMTRQADFKRRVRARMAKTGESYAAARAQLLAARDLGDGDPLAALHVTNGDSAAAVLHATGLVRRVLPWRDALHEGPVPEVSDAELRRVRALFLSDDDPAELQQGLLRWLEQRDHGVAANRDGAYVLWFEADLYDQLQLVQILARLGELRVPPRRITLVCIGEHLGIAHFGGLGELRPEQLRELLGTAATPLTPAALELAAGAWAALRSPEPSGLGTVAARPSPELRFVAEAFDRLSREYPSTRDGLGLTERRIVAAAGAGAGTAGAVFARVGAREARPYLGDTFCWRIMGRLVHARTPLLGTDPHDAPIEAGTHVWVTAAGQRVLRGEADHVSLNGIDRWIGGVHLVGEDARWRWDEGTEAIV
jgi:Domain of unknown function (DUF1835)